MPSRNTLRSSGPQPSSRWRSTTSLRRCCWGFARCLILAAFLFEWRTAFSLIAIPLSLLAAVLVLVSRSATINVMMLAGLIVAIGVVVDDAIIDVENIVRRLRQNRSEGTGKSTLAIVLDASVEVRTAITYATLINVVAIVPVFFLPGLSGAFFKPLVLIRDCGARLDGSCADGHSGAVPDPPLQRAKAPGIPPAAGAQAWLRSWSCAHHPHPAASDGHRCCVPAGRRRGDTNAREDLFPTFKERDFLMHWLTKPPARRRKRRVLWLRAARICGRSRSAQLRISHWAGFPGGGNIRCELRRELDQHQSRGRL